MDEYEQTYRKNIKNFADRLRERAKGSNLYGLPIDENDADMMIMAAYYIGQIEVTKTWQQRLDVLQGVTDGQG